MRVRNNSSQVFIALGLALLIFQLRLFENKTAYGVVTDFLEAD